MQPNPGCKVKVFDRSSVCPSCGWNLVLLLYRSKLFAVYRINGSIVDISKTLIEGNPSPDIYAVFEWVKRTIEWPFVNLQIRDTG